MPFPISLPAAERKYSRLPVHGGSGFGFNACRGVVAGRSVRGRRGPPAANKSFAKSRLLRFTQEKVL